MEGCIFCRIIRGKIPSNKVYEDDQHLAFLIIRPINPGHTLVIPKKHTDYFFDLEDQELSELVIKSKPIAKALKKAFNPQTGKVGVMIAGMAVPHAHIHLIPMNSEGDLTFAKAKDASSGELKENQEKIKAALE